MSHNPEEVKKHIKAYLGVFAELAVLTIVTVAVSYWHLPIGWAVLVALIIASFKASLVAGFFMHLLQEKPIVFWLLLITVLMFIPLLLIPVLS